MGIRYVKKNFGSFGVVDDTPYNSLIGHDDRPYQKLVPALQRLKRGDNACENIWALEAHP